MSDLIYHDLLSLDDPLYDEYLDLYQLSFPLNEQELVSGHNRILRASMRGEVTVHRLMTVLTSGGEPVGMVRYQLAQDVGVLWYLAVSRNDRGAGIGSEVYAEVVRRVRKEIPHASALVYEVERPESADDGEMAGRRIRFYQRNGGFVLTGVAYTQSVGWQAPIPMHLMVHPFRAMTAAEAVGICQAVFGETVQVVDAPGLSGLG